MNVEYTDFNDAFEMLELKWHKVLLNKMHYNHKQILEWLTANCRGRVKFHAALFVFEDARDATMFSLRWL